MRQSKPKHTCYPTAQCVLPGIDYEGNNSVQRLRVTGERKLRAVAVLPYPLWSYGQAAQLSYLLWQCCQGAALPYILWLYGLVAIFSLTILSGYMMAI